MSELLVEHLAKTYPTRGEPLVVLRDVSLRLTAGQNAAILGPSGSGKSTLLFILGTLEQPTAGQVRLDGVDPFALSELELADFRNRRLGFVFQDHYLLPQLSVLENVLVPALAHGGIDGQLEARARDLLTRVGLADRLDHRPAELSGGERQRAAARGCGPRPAAEASPPAGRRADGQPRPAQRAGGRGPTRRNAAAGADDAAGGHAQCRSGAAIAAALCPGGWCFIGGHLAESERGVLGARPAGAFPEAS